MSTSSSSSGDSSSSAIAAVAIVVLVVIALIAGVVLFTRWNPFVAPGSGEQGGEGGEGSNPMPTLALPTMEPRSSSGGGSGLYLQVDS